MRKLFILALILARPLFGQTSGTIVHSEPFVLKPKTASTAPRITLQEPSVLEGASIVEKTNRLSIKGSASATSGIKRIEINGLVTNPSKSGGIAARVPLRNGSNQITINVEDNSGNVAIFSFGAMCDTQAPVIEIIQPKAVGLRGIRNVVADTTVLIARVFDDCLLNEVTVNGVPVQVGPDSLITAQLSLRDQVDTVRIAATDVGGHITERMIPISLRPQSMQPDFMAGKSYALVIGIDAYTGRWPRLKNAVNDARAVAQTLRSRFQFERVDSLYDEQATRDNVLGKIESIGRSLQPEDRFLIYYSGHGLKEPPYNKGYWVPVDATDRSIGRYISNRDIQDYMAGMNPRHVLLVADACFAGDIFKGGTMRYGYEDNTNYYRRVTGVKSRKALTSGGDEPVMDGGSPGHSVFASYFLKALEGIDKRYFSAWEVYDRIRIAVVNNSQQDPQFDAIKNSGDEGGEFLFVRR